MHEVVGVAEMADPGLLGLVKLTSGASAGQEAEEQARYFTNRRSSTPWETFASKTTPPRTRSDFPSLKASQK